MFHAGEVLNFNYPDFNRYCRRTRLSPRRVVVRSIRDLAAAPLDPLSLRLRPDLRRSRILVHTLDLDRQRLRCFYLDSMRTLRVSQQPLRRLAIFDPTREQQRPTYFGPVWTDCRRDQQAMQSLLREVREWFRSRGERLSVGAFALGG